MYCTIIILKVISPRPKKRLDRQSTQKIGSNQAIKHMCLSTIGKSTVGDLFIETEQELKGFLLV